MKKKTFTGKLLRYERRNNSYYGNPKYFGVFEDAEGNEYCALVNTERKQPADYRFVYDSTKASLTEYRLNGKVKMPFNGSSDPNSESMGLILYPGQMMLFRIDRK